MGYIPICDRIARIQTLNDIAHACEIHLTLEEALCTQRHMCA